PCVNPVSGSDSDEAIRSWAYKNSESGWLTFFPCPPDRSIAGSSYCLLLDCVMQMEAFLWMFLPVFVAGGSALLSYYVMQARMDVALARERESLAEARATISSQKITMEERIKAAEEATKRQAMEEFMQELRVEERSYVRESKSLSASRKSMVMQERLFF